MNSLNNIIKVFNKLSHEAIQKPIFDGLNSSKFLSKYEAYASLNKWTDPEKVQHLPFCCSPDIEDYVRAHCYQTDAFGNKTPVSWTVLRSWIGQEYGNRVPKNFEVLVRDAENVINHPRSQMQKEESLHDFLNRFNQIVQNVNDAREQWNDQHKPPPNSNQQALRKWDAERYYPVGEQTKVGWFLDKLNHNFFDYANNTYDETSSFSEILSDLFQKEYTRKRSAQKFGIAYTSPSANMKDEFSTSQLAVLQQESRAVKRELKKAVAALEREKKLHVKNLETALKNKSFTPVNAIASLSHYPACSQTQTQPQTATPIMQPPPAPPSTQPLPTPPITQPPIVSYGQAPDPVILPHTFPLQAAMPIPPGSTPRSSAPGSSSVPIVCYLCGGVGHQKSNCPNTHNLCQMCWAARPCQMQYSYC